MERETGIEPATSSLGSWRSTAELLPLGDSKLKRLTRYSRLYNRPIPKRFPERSDKTVQIIIPRELICKKCSVL